ncbi:MULTISPECIES: CitMHS family transporter [unclassified Peribacillus]|uniref:CitMHS family transporter n=1 Tax=unclassified Peribacillus TaxID=2675266 RepID=UPI001914D7C6|nr:MULTISPECIES: citrate:proton symporter [unclassified Peribacillus]MBK5445306.1 citrate transporter [Peribacillus sp. TH24]MBK5459969.1 citrate transporter [Peribacillus sp. TH27]MBK5498161.1 citrate transporter [Peribacillus sp. TH14]WMX56723.1 citrate:proton symporter [Peribacillus sp. R9-11]
MLSILGFCMILTFLVLVITKRLSVVVAFIFTAIAFGLIGGFASEMGEMMVAGILKVTPTAVMIVFAILYFGLMIDVGLFEPMIAKILSFVKGDPLKIVMATAIITMLVGLDGDGSSTFMITVSAMLPLYMKLGMNRLVLASVVGLAAGVMNIIPWGGPLVRAAASLQVEVSDLFIPLIPVMICGLLWTLFAAYILGKRERERLGVSPMETAMPPGMSEQAAAVEASYGTSKLFWFNWFLTILLMVLLVMEVLPIQILFAAAFAIALFVNFPNPQEQQERILSHANSFVMICTLIFAAGIFTGVFTETKMMDSMAASIVTVIPDWLGAHLPLVVALTSIPMGFIFSPDAYYFGILPIISETASNFGITPVEIGRAALLGHSTIGFPLSPLVPATFILIGLVGVDFGDHQKFLFKWAFGTTIVMTIAAITFGVISL